MCVECDNVALSYCTMFGDYMCLACFARLHQKGSRRNAKAYKLEVCQLCKSKAAKLQCGYTGRLFCLEYLLLLGGFSFFSQLCCCIHCTFGFVSCHH